MKLVDDFESEDKRERGKRKERKGEKGHTVFLRSARSEIHSPSTPVIDAVGTGSLDSLQFFRSS
jgi:hypothetical protein